MTPSEHVRRRIKLLHPFQRRVIELRYLRRRPYSFAEITKVLREETGRRFRGTRAVSVLHWKALQNLRRMHGIVPDLDGRLVELEPVRQSALTRNVDFP